MKVVVDFVDYIILSRGRNNFEGGKLNYYFVIYWNKINI